MTEPVAATASPRRTVRVSVALVAGQAVLCLVVGWIAFGSSRAGPPAAKPVEPMAGPPIVVPTASASRPSSAVPVSISPSVSSPVSPSAARTKVPARPAPAASAPPKTPPKTEPDLQPRIRPTEEPPVTGISAPSGAPATRTVSPNPGPADPAAPPPSPAVQAPVEEGETCAPLSAPGRTPDGVELTCVRDPDGDLRWRIR